MNDEAYVEDAARLNDKQCWTGLVDRADDGADSKGTDGGVEGIGLDV